MSTFLEREIKLTPAEGLDLAGLSGEPLERRSFSSTYYDTEENLLAGLGITLRRRVEHGGSLWQLKLPRAGGRLELERPGGPAGPPNRIASVLNAVLRGRELKPVAELRTVRKGVRVRSDASTADIVLDHVSVMENLHVVSRFDELEIELVEGDPRALRRIERAVRRAGAKDGDSRPKVLRVIGPPAQASKRPSRLQAFFRRQYEQILLHDPGTRLGDDPEDLHDLRVAVRRLRAILRVAAPPLDENWADELRDELDWLAQVLGPVRDLDVMLEHLRGEQATLPGEEAEAFEEVLGKLERERSERRKAMLSLMRSARYQRLLDRLEEAALRPRTRAARPRLRKITARQFDEVRKGAAELGLEPSDEELHRIRIKGKRARYAAELTASRKRHERFVEAAKKLQDVIGEHQDAVVTAQRLRDVAVTCAETAAFVAGRVAEREEARKHAARAKLPRVWAAFERAGKRAWT